MTKSLDLKFSKKDLSFFSDIVKIKSEIKKFKSEPIINFTEKDVIEIGRGKSYAVFEELRNEVDKGNKVTIESFRSSLTKRGIIDTKLQNKILCMILQDKAGVQYTLGNIVDNLLIGNNFNLLMNRNYELDIEVNSDKKVTLIFKGIWEDFNKDPKEPVISVSASVAIASDEVLISSFKITQISDSQLANASYQFLKDNQKNIIEKIVYYIKEFFGFNTELKLEESNDENISWLPNNL